MTPHYTKVRAPHYITHNDSTLCKYKKNNDSALYKQTKLLQLIQNCHHCMTSNAELTWESQSYWTKYQPEKTMHNIYNINKCLQFIDQHQAKIPFPYWCIIVHIRVSKIVITISTSNSLHVQYKHWPSEPVTSMCTVKPQKTNEISET